MTPRIGLCFCHGWGFDPHFWEPLLPSFSNYPILRWNLGYYGEKSLPLPDSSADRWIAIGHSVGFRKLIESPVDWSGAVCIQGFYDFLGSEPRMRKIRQRSLEKMISDWYQNRNRVLQNFYETCGLASANFPTPPPSWSVLEVDLQTLAIPSRMSFPPSSPHRVLGSRENRVVPPSLMESEWGLEKITWSEKGGHALGFFESDFVAETIHSLIREVRENRHL